VEIYIVTGLCEDGTWGPESAHLSKHGANHRVFKLIKEGDYDQSDADTISLITAWELDPPVLLGVKIMILCDVEDGSILAVAVEGLEENESRYELKLLK